MKLTATKYNTTALDWGLLLLRVFTGIAMIANHGLGKAQKLLNGGEIKFADPIGIGAKASLYLAVFAEVFCALLLIFGLFTRLATLPLIVTMAVAAFVVHATDPFSKMESSLLFLFVLFLLFLAGPGKYSVDRMISKG